MQRVWFIISFYVLLCLLIVYAIYIVIVPGNPFIKDPYKRNEYIPKRVFMTYRDIDSIPAYVRENINTYCKGYNVQLYDDNRCIAFLKEHYGDKVVDVFNNMRIGAYKSDLWRYCILYKLGGYYFDIKTDFQTHIDNIFNVTTPNKWYTCIANNKDALYQGVIATPANNPILLNAIKYICDNPKPKIYDLYLKNLYALVKKECNMDPMCGLNIQENGWVCELFQEACTSCASRNTVGCDRYNLNCNIVNSSGTKLFNTRYTDFPW